MRRGAPGFRAKTSTLGTVSRGGREPFRRRPTTGEPMKAIKVAIWSLGLLALGCAPTESTGTGTGGSSTSGSAGTTGSAGTNGSTGSAGTTGNAGTNGKGGSTTGSAGTTGSGGSTTGT